MPPPAAAGIPVNPAPGGQGTLPWRPNDVILTDWSKQQLQKLGWKEGDAIPPNFNKQLAAAQHTYRQDLEAARLKLIEDGKAAGGRVQIKRVIDIADLPDAEQQKLRQVLADYQQTARQEAAVAAAQAAREARVVQNADPSVQAAHRAAMATEEQGIQFATPAALQQLRAGGPPHPDMPEVVLQHAAANLPPQLQPPDGFQVGGAQNIAPFITNTQPPQAPPQPEPPPATMDPATIAGGIPEIHNCPRCMWDLKQPFTVEPTEADKQLFVAAILGAQRFIKTISVMGGNLQITYRSLLSTETDLVFRQLAYDMRQNRLTDDASYFMLLQTYRLLMSVASIQDGIGRVLVEIPPAAELGIDDLEGEPTILRKLNNWFNENVAPMESTRRIIVQHQHAFQRLVEALEVMTAEADFWTGIRPRT